MKTALAAAALIVAFAACRPDSSDRSDGARAELGRDDPVAVTTNSFDAEVLGASRPVVVQFHATWCKHCRTLESRLAEVAPRHAGAVRLVTVDVAAEPELAQRYEIESVPVLAFFVDGELAGRVGGLRETSALDPLFRSLAGASKVPIPDAIAALAASGDEGSCGTGGAVAEGGVCDAQ